MIMLGLCISIRLVTLLPMLVQILPPNQIGRCYSIIVVFGEFGVVILSFFSGIIREWAGQYNEVLNLFLVVQLISVIFAVKMIKF